MGELHPRVKDALIRMGFIARYEELSEQFSAGRMPPSERLIYIDGEMVLEMLRDLGYEPSFHAKEKFYKIKEEQAGTFSFGFHILLRDGMATFVWVVRESGEVLLGSPWSVYSKIMGGAGHRIKTPVFGSYEDLEELLERAFGMYENFKRAFLND